MLGRIGDIKQIENTQRKFGSNSTYYLVRLQRENKTEVSAMFTEHQLQEAIERAEANQEDLVAEGFLDRVRDLLD